MRIDDVRNIHREVIFESGNDDVYVMALYGRATSWIRSSR